MGAKRPPKLPHPLSPEPRPPWGPRRRRGPWEERARLAGAECFGPGKGTSGSQGWAVRLIQPKKEYVQPGQAGGAGPTGPGSPLGAPTAEKQTRSLCPQRGLGATDTLGAISRRPGLLRLSWPEKPLSESPDPSLDPSFKMARRMQVPPLLPKTLSPKVQHPSSTHPGATGPLHSVLCPAGDGGQASPYLGPGLGKSQGLPAGSLVLHEDGRARGGRWAQTTEAPAPRVLEDP